ncbi:MAG: cupin domain-containing protein [Candidatus Latescibacteria bacterium]|jgi:quercetin dioxygenase-like cupin family protein|nr:cupin domain-containing protein [Candidatus Latescibacterota bacterium]MDP7237089.1 cupin domain-containing protein [Candidatus Latescibacterota bacterium]
MSATRAFASHARDANWVVGLRPCFEYRDLGIKDATDGKVLVQVIRANQTCDGPMGYHSHILDFQMTYMLKGSALIDFEEVGQVRVEAGDAWYQPRGVKHEVLEYSDDFEVIEIAMPAEFPTVDEER